ncbi:DUF4230 domain-containing protein [Clostridium disporicum]|uniref:DUF4230 domain-containing protein n=2 Tax=Clostridium TaxID=1485 RepID=UPI002901B87B|nr:DUF4230 domain-containing protein [Clostridium celatum]
MGITIFLYKKKSKFKLHKLLLYLLSLLIFCLLILFFKYPSKFQKLLPYFHSYKIESSNILSDDILINEIRNVNKLIPLEVELSETLTIDNTYFNLDIFKKSKKATFFANCSYSIDFSNLSKSNFEINNSTKEIYITIPQIDIFSIDIDESKTIYSDTELGFLRFGDLKFSSEELNSIYENLNSLFTAKMKTSKFYDQAITNTEKSLKDLLFNLTGENYNVILKVS